MIFVYYVIMAVILLFATPLASQKLAYSYPGHGNYSALQGYNSATRKVVYTCFAVACVLLIINCIFRDEFLPDYLTYEWLYNAGGSSKVSREYEQTFNIIVKYSPTFLILLGVYAVISCSINMYGLLKNSPNIWLSLLLYLTFWYVLHDMIQIRAGVACALMLVGVRYIQERKWIIYFLICFVAMSFHNSAVIMFPLYFLPKKNCNKWVWTIILGVALLFSAMNYQFGLMARSIPVGFVQTYLENYIGNKNYTSSSLGFTRFLKIGLCILMLFNQKKITRQYPYAPVVLGQYMCSLLCYLLFADIPVLQGRMGEFLGVSEIFALSMLPFISKKHYYIWFAVPIVIAIYNFGMAVGLMYGM